MRIARPLAIWWLVLTLAAPLIAQPAPSPTLQKQDGTRVDWDEWLAAHGPTAVVVWASWLPQVRRDIKELGEIRRVAEAQGLDFVVVAIQEPIGDSRMALESSGLQWLHDRHGSMLQHLLVYSVPSLAVVDSDGTVRVRLESNAGALSNWTKSQ